MAVVTITSTAALVTSVAASEAASAAASEAASAVASMAKSSTARTSIAGSLVLMGGRRLLGGSG